MTITPMISSIDEVESLVGAELGPSSWRVIPQEDINLYADLTGDDNPIHVDQEIAAQSPYGGTIAHGMLTLSMIVVHLREIYRVTGAGMGIVYGFNKIRFPNAVPAGARIRVHGHVESVTPVANGWQVVLPLTFELEGATKPACVAEIILRHYR